MVKIFFYHVGNVAGEKKTCECGELTIQKLKKAKLEAEMEKSGRLLVGRLYIGLWGSIFGFGAQGP